MLPLYADPCFIFDRLENKTRISIRGSLRTLKNRPLTNVWNQERHDLNKHSCCTHQGYIKGNISCLNSFLLSARPYNIQNFNNNIRRKPYTKNRGFFGFFMALKLRQPLRQKDKCLYHLQLFFWWWGGGGGSFKNDMIVLTITKWAIGLWETKAGSLI